MMKKITALLLALLLLSGALAARAAEMPDPERPGSLCLLLDWEGVPLTGGKVTLYRVADVAQQGGNAVFVLIPQLEGTGLSLEDLEDTALPQALADKALEKKLPPLQAPVQGGKAEFSQLLPGLYVVTQNRESACDGFEPIDPFLISLPRWEKDGYAYDITAEPKVALEKTPDETTEPTEPEPTQPEDTDLPQTGQLNWPIPVIATAGLALFALGWFLCFGKREHHEN